MDFNNKLEGRLPFGALVDTSLQQMGTLIGQIKDMIYEIGIPNVRGFPFIHVL